MCSLDPSLFYMHLDNKIVGIICVYVDDFLWAGTDYFRKNIVDKLYDLFLIGDEASASFRYVGLNISTDCSNNITIDQNMYASALLPVKISSERSANKSSALSDSEKDEYRAVIGQLNWLATQTRPDIAFETCDLSVSLKKATVNELLRLNKLVCRVKNTPLKIVFPQMSSIESCRLVGYADASFANLCEGKSQGGFIIFLVDSCGNHCPIIWQSRTIRRVVKSTLAAETLALLDCVEAGFYVARIIQELTGVKINFYCKVDNKSLVDATYSSKSVDDRRLRIDVAVLRNMLENKEIEDISWICSNLQLADSLTKRGACTQRLRAALSQN